MRMISAHQFLKTKADIKNQYTRQKSTFCKYFTKQIKNPRHSWLKMLVGANLLREATSRCSVHKQRRRTFLQYIIAQSDRTMETNMASMITVADTSSLLRLSQTMFKIK